VKLDFVVGTGRCGSSLVHEILASHEHVGFISNLDDNFPSLRMKGRLNNRLYSLTKGSWTRKGAARFAPSEAFQLMSRQVSPIYENSCRDLLATDASPWLRLKFQSFFEARWHAQGRPLFLHKYTGWPRIGFFSSIFPESRFVHIVRDGRAVANSWLQADWWGGYRGPDNWSWGPLAEDLQDEWEASGRSFVTLAGMAWRILIESFERAAKPLAADRYHEVRYEDVLAKPEESLRSIADFIGLEWSARVSGAVAKVRFDASRERAFERDLTATQVTQLEKCIGPLLNKYGYQ